MKARIFTTMLALFAIATAAQAQFGGGDGSKYSPYIISTTDHWTELANNVNSGNNYRDTYFRLDADLDFTGKTYTIIADDYVHNNISFDGKFDGNGHTIKGVTIDRTEPGMGKSIYIGLFGTIRSNAIVENLTLSNSTIKGRTNVGGIVGRTGDFITSDPNRRSVVRNCHVTGDVTIETVQLYYNGNWQPSGNVGGIVGAIESDRGVVLDCTSAATIKASSNSQNVGGIAGSVYKGRVSGCAYTGSISGGTDYVGGIVGVDYRNAATVTDNFLGGACTIGAVGVEGSLQGTDEGYSVSHIYTIRFNSAQLTNGTIDTQPTKTISGTNYYAAGSTITLSNVSSFGTPGGGNMWSYRAYVNNSNQPGVFPQEDGTWQFTMPNGNALIVPEGAIDITLTGYPYNTKVTFTPANATYTGSALHPTAVVEARGTTLTESTQFFTDIPAAGFTNAGKYPVKIWGMGGYAGLRIDTFTIARAPLTELTLSETSVYHDGAAHKPTLIVKSGSKTLVKGTNYETDLPSEGFTELGDHIIKVWGIGNYTDTLSATYTICHPWDGMGTQYEPFLIKNTDDMDRLAALVNGGKDYAGVYFRQTADLDYAGKTYTPVGTMAMTSQGADFPFNGHFNTYFGIKFLNVNIDQDLAGLFGYVGPQGEIQSVTLSGVGTISGKMSGGIVAINEGRVESCSVDTATVSIVGGAAVGGIVAVNRGVVIPNKCKASVSNDARYAVPELPLFVVGGIVGLNTGDDDPETDKGGVYGEFSGNVTVTAIDTCLCVAGGVVGYNNSVGKVRATMQGTITSSGTDAVIGGVVGGNEEGGIVEGCLSDFLMTDVEGAHCGAIVGLNADDISTVRNCYYIGECRYGGINNADTIGKAMRGWPIIETDGDMGFSEYSDPVTGENRGIYYEDKNGNHHFYGGAGETIYFTLMNTEWFKPQYTANGVALSPTTNEYGETYYSVTMPADTVLLAYATATDLELLDDDSQVSRWNRNDYRIAMSDGVLCNVTIKDRTLHKGIWNTLCLPFNLDDFEGTPLKDATVKTLTSSSYANGTLTLNFTTATTIEAGKPYLVKWASGDNIDDPVFENVTIRDTLASTETDCVDFIGSYDIVYLTAQDRTVLYLGGDSNLYYPTVEVPVNAFRGYFQLNGLTAGDLPNSAKNFVLNFGDSTTEIVNYQLSTVNSNDSWYSIDGRRLQGKPTQKGVYIRNGKKIIK